LIFVKKRRNIRMGFDLFKPFQSIKNEIVKDAKSVGGFIGKTLPKVGSSAGQIIEKGAGKLYGAVRNVEKDQLGLATSSISNIFSSPGLVVVILAVIGGLIIMRK
jgi:hypothetical protein